MFGALAGYNYWFPKAFGFTLDERWGKASFWCWLIGFYLAFMPLYALGLMGMTRRLEHIPDPSWRPLLLVAEAGAIVIFLAILCQAVQLYVSIRTREQRRDLTGDPWNGRTLEWSTSSPPPAYNLRGAAQCRDDRRLLGDETRRTDSQRTARGRTGLSNHRDAAQQLHRFCHRLFCGDSRLFG